jgi:hypothetical protein
LNARKRRRSRRFRNEGFSQDRSGKGQQRCADQEIRTTAGLGTGATDYVSALNGPQDAHGKKDDRSDQFERAADGDSYYAKRQQQQPNYWI